MSTTCTKSDEHFKKTDKSRNNEKKIDSSKYKF